MVNKGIIIKGNKDGLNAEIDMDKFDNFDQMLSSLTEKLSKGKEFYKDSTLCITTNLSDLSKKQGDQLKDVLLKQIVVKEIIFEDNKESNENINSKENNSQKKSEKVFNGIHEGKTKFFRKTIRGGQKINFQGNIVIIGDVNHGSEVYASGNIIVLGEIKGKVFAGKDGNRESIIAAFCLQPEILKIADIITMSPDSEKPKFPEVARIKDSSIIVEPYLNNKYI